MEAIKYDHLIELIENEDYKDTGKLFWVNSILPM